MNAPKTTFHIDTIRGVLRVDICSGRSFGSYRMTLEDAKRFSAEVSQAVFMLLAETDPSLPERV